MKGRLIKFLAIALIFVAIIFVPMLLEENSSQNNKINKETSPSDSLFYTYDVHGNLYEAFFDEEEKVYYLFLSSETDASNVVINSKEEIKNASCGKIENQKITGAFNNNGDFVEVETTEGEYKVKFMQSSLPSMYIDLEKVSLEDIHKDKSAVYSGNSVYIYDKNRKNNLSIPNSVEIKGRGNSSWTEYEKKSYQIKFSEAVSVLGMEREKTWLLLANASDDSLMRNSLVYSMASEMDMAFVPDYQYVDLWVDGEYRGTFLVCEKVEIGENRLNLKNGYGAIFEHDEAFYQEEAYSFLFKPAQRHFTLKDINTKRESVIENAIGYFSDSLYEFVNYLYSTPSSQITISELSKLIDVDSFCKYYLINEFTQNRESFATSFYWYQDGKNDVLHLGPIWDYDTCIGNDSALYTDYYATNHLIFRYLMASEEFYQRTLEIYEEYKELFVSLPAFTEEIYEEIKLSADMNYIRWDVLGKPGPKDGALDFASSFEDSVAFVNTWLKNRAEVFEIQKTNTVSSVVSEDCSEMVISFEDLNKYQSVKFAVWSSEGGQDDLRLYSASKEDGFWVSKVDLANHKYAGVYRISVYCNDELDAFATGYNYVQVDWGENYALSAEVSDDRYLNISLDDSMLYSVVYFAVWSDENAQDDLVWYAAERSEDSLWKYKVDLKDHIGEGLYHIHAYTNVSGEEKFLDNVTATVYFKTDN